MYVSHILRGKGSNVVTLSAVDSIAEAATLLRTHRIGALVIVDGAAEIVGVLSERDIVYALAERGAETLDLAVSELMSRIVQVCAPEDEITDVMELMTRRRIRHVPVVADGRLAGIISIGDVVKYRLDEMEFEVNSLKDYVRGAVG